MSLTTARSSGFWAVLLLAGAFGGAAGAVELELPGYTGATVHVVDLVPPYSTGAQIPDPNLLGQPTVVAVAGGRVQLNLTASPVLITSPTLADGPYQRDLQGPFCLAAPAPAQEQYQYTDVAAQVAELQVAIARSSGAGDARFDDWRANGVNGLHGCDERVLSAQQAGCEVVIVLRATPSGGSNTVLPDLNEWRDFVRDVVRRYNGDGVADVAGLLRPAYGYVIHNEPDYDRFWNDTAANYGRLAAAAAETVKTYQPTAKVVLAGSAGSVASYLRAGEPVPRNAANPANFSPRASDYEDGFFLAAARTANENVTGGDRFDAVDFHFYQTYDQWTQFRSFAHYVRRLAAYAKWSGAEVWCTETGTWGPPMPNSSSTTNQTETQQAQSLVKRYLYGRAAGVKHIFWFGLQASTSVTGDDSQTNWFPIALRVDSQPRLAYYAWRTMARKLSGCDWDRSGVALDGDNSVYMLEFVRSGEKLWVAWQE